MRLPRTLRGFTLIELMVVLLLIAITLTWAIPSLQDVQARHTRENDIHAIMSALRYARKQSLIQNTTVLLCPRGKNSLCGDSWQQGLQLSIGGNLLRQFSPVAKGSKLHWRGLAGGTHIYFKPTRVASNSNGHFEYIPAGETAVTDHLIVNRAGHIHRQRVK